MMKIALAQLRSTNNQAFNFSVCEKLIKEASQHHQASLICFPECFAFMGNNATETLAHAGSLDSELFKSYTNLAKKYNINISYGGWHETSPFNQNKIFNSHVLVNNQGEIINIYRKVHLFDLNTEMVKLKESEITEFGQDLLVDDNGSIFSKDLIVGLSICYDLRFPELFILQRKLRDVKIVLIPAAFTKHTGELGHWKTLLQARAIENQCFVVAAAQVGRHNSRRESYGHSLIIDPLGKILLDLGQQEHVYDLEKQESQPFEGLLGIVDMSTWSAQLSKVREGMPVFEHKRNDLYHLDIVTNK
ncbi:hypothetical protein C9374_013788 [Naegleria lovaniensis]|uniref:CN hydrolase domain-containing protein n=1 Tax=Naegleria lovaniensis TaxID=51637 RepID=A0AA88G937_NAELO|nr:uncharacterized protein C9374_013788 [Naegleria lovaniensis]KAG2370832.1 hypothetical protein C9374_013788 [Naegleria lovaniensis]